MYEVETKIELNKAEKDALIESLIAWTFSFVKDTDQNDYYVEAKESVYKNKGGKYDLKRYRKENDTYIYTEKTWEEVGDGVARKEIEKSVDEQEFNKKVSEFPNAIKISKTREWYIGEYEGEKISVTIDSVKFDHSDGERYFVEAEIGVEDISKVKETEEKLQSFLVSILKKDKLVVSPGMFSMAFNRL